MSDAAVQVSQKSGVRDSARYRLVKFADMYLIWVLLAAGVAVMTAISLDYFTGYNLINLLLGSSILGIMVIAEALCLLIGKLDLSVESTLAFSALIGAIMVTRGANPYLSMFVVLAVGAAIGLINGIFIVRFGVNPFVQTLSMNIIFRGAIFLISGGLPFYGFPEAYRVLGATRFLGIPTPIVIMVLLYAVFIIALEKTKWGRSVYAIGQNSNAAYSSGIETGKVTVIVYTLAGLLSALAGLILSTRLNSMDYNVARGMVFDIMAAAVIGGISLSGGRGRLIGAIGGVLFFNIVSSILTWLNLSIYWVETTRGFIIAAAVVIDALKNKLRKAVLRTS